MGTPKKALVLSGGGGRGAYQIGVIKRLTESGWLEEGRGPDYIAGTSIGALHGAALAGGMDWRGIWRNWQDAMTTDRVNTPAGPSEVRPFVQALLHGTLTPEAEESLGGAPTAEEEPLGGAPTTEEDALGGAPASSGGGLFAGLRDRIMRTLGQHFLRENHLLRSHWVELVESWDPPIDWARINSLSAPTLIIPATDVRRGTRTLFCNRPWRDLDGLVHSATAIGPAHVNASASIQAIYQPGEAADPRTGELRSYWDGATVDNTPLDSLLDVARDTDLDIVVVLMTPWHEPGDSEIELPQHLYQALTPAVDWMLLGPFRVALKRLAERGLRPPTIIDPPADFWRQYLAIDRLVEYKDDIHPILFDQGYLDASMVV